MIGINVAPPQGSGYVNSLIISAVPTALLKLSWYSSLASAQFVMLFDSPTVPADGQTPVYTFNAPTVASGSELWLPDGVMFYSGIVVCNSTTAPAKTLGAANTWFTAVIAAKK